MFYTPYTYAEPADSDFIPGFYAMNAASFRPKNVQTFGYPPRMVPRSMPSQWEIPQCYASDGESSDEDEVRFVPDHRYGHSAQRGGVFIQPQMMGAPPAAPLPSPPRHHHNHHHHHHGHRPGSRSGSMRRPVVAEPEIVNHAIATPEIAAPYYSRNVYPSQSFVSYDHIDHPKRRGIDQLSTDVDEYREYVRRKIEEEELQLAARRAEETRRYKEEKARKAEEKRRKTEEKKRKAEEKKRKAEEKRLRAEQRRIAEEQETLRLQKELELAAEKEMIRQAQQAQLLLIHKQETEREMRRQASEQQRLEQREAELAKSRAQEQRARELRAKQLNEERKVLFLQLFGRGLQEDNRCEQPQCSAAIHQKKPEPVVQKQERQPVKSSESRRQNKASADASASIAAQKHASEEQIRESAKMAARAHYQEMLRQQQKSQENKEKSERSTRRTESVTKKASSSTLSNEELKRKQARRESEARQRLLAAARKHAEEEAAALRAREEAENAAALSSQDSIQVQRREDVPEQFWEEFSKQLAEITAAEDDSLSENDIITVTISDRGRVKRFYVPAPKVGDLRAKRPASDSEKPKNNTTTMDVDQDDVRDAADLTEDKPKSSPAPSYKTLNDISEPEVEEPSDEHETDVDSVPSGNEEEDWSEVEHEDAQPKSPTQTAFADDAASPPKPLSPTSSIRHVTSEDVEDSDSSSSISL